jgi:hypothetical protein
MVTTFIEIKPATTSSVVSDSIVCAKDTRHQLPRNSMGIAGLSAIMICMTSAHACCAGVTRCVPSSVAMILENVSTTAATNKFATSKEQISTTGIKKSAGSASPMYVG